MVRRRVSTSRQSKQQQHLGKPNGRIDARVQAVAPEHFGIVCVDPHKGSSQWMFADYYGRVLIPPTEVGHRRGDLDLMLARLARAEVDWGIKDRIVVVERTGQYHLPIRRAFENADYDVRTIHPYAVKQYRQVADPGNKTDATDLAAMKRAAADGFALSEEPPPPPYRQLRELVRHRRLLVRQSAALRCQIRERLDAMLPGYGALFGDLFDGDMPLSVARRFPSADAIRSAGPDVIADHLRGAGIPFLRTSVAKIFAWAHDAAPSAPDPQLQARLFADLADDWSDKHRRILRIEAESAALFVQTPLLLLLALPGLGVVSAAEFAGELGPLEHYASANAITGRAGLCPTRYQSHGVDRAGGPLKRVGNHRLRAALMRIADNLCKCNDHFKSKAIAWMALGKDPRAIRVRVVKGFTRLAYAIVAQRHWFIHHALQPRAAVLAKLIDFHNRHAADIDMSQRREDLQAAARWIPEADRADEARPFVDQLEKLARRRAGPTPIGELIPLVLELLGQGAVQSGSSEEPSPG